MSHDKIRSLDLKIFEVRRSKYQVTKSNSESNKSNPESNKYSSKSSEFKAFRTESKGKYQGQQWDMNVYQMQKVEQ